MLGPTLGPEPWTPIMRSAQKKKQLHAVAKKFTENSLKNQKKSDQLLHTKEERKLNDT
jgi:hypothetical protein